MEESAESRCSAMEPPERNLSTSDLGLVCPSCREPWLRVAGLPGRYRCVYCLHRFELASLCPNCGEHSTLVRMTATETLSCNSCGRSMLLPL